MIPSALSVPTISGLLLDNLFWLLLVVGLGVLGFLVLWKRWRPLALYLACYFGLLLVWPWNQDRFLVPVIPYFLLALLLGARELGTFLGERWRWVPAAALTGVLAVSGLAAEVDLVRIQSLCDRSIDPPSLGCEPPQRQSFVAAARFARDSLPPGAAFVVGKDASFAYLSGRKVVPAAALIGESSETVVQRIRDLNADFLFVGRVHSEDIRLAQTLLPACESLAHVRTVMRDSHFFRLAAERGGVDAAARGGVGAEGRETEREGVEGAGREATACSPLERTLATGLAHSSAEE